MSDYLIASIRTLIPGAIGAVVTWLASLGLNVSTDAQSSLVAAAGFVIAALWYLIVHALERRWPKLGVLLGVPSKPIYAKVGTADEAAVITSLPDAAPAAGDTTAK